MNLKYFIHTIRINKKHQKKQVITWEQQKKFVFDIFEDLKKNNLFNIEDKDKTNYNILGNYGSKNKSLCLIPLKKGDNNSLICSKLYSSEKNKFLEEDLTELNVENNSNIYHFRIGLIKHEDIEIFKNGDIDSIFKYLNGENSGLLSKTDFLLVMDDDLKKPVLIKFSGDGTVGIGAFTYYLENKSSNYKMFSHERTFKIISEAFKDEFNKKDIDVLKSMTISIDGDLIRKHKNTTTDPFLRTIINTFKGGFEKAKSMEFSLKFLEDGNTDAVNYFNEFHSDFLAEADESIIKLVDKFKVCYDSKSQNKEKKFNFKRKPKTLYELEHDVTGIIDHKKHLLDAFKFYKGQ